MHTNRRFKLHYTSLFFSKHMVLLPVLMVASSATSFTQTEQAIIEAIARYQKSGIRSLLEKGADPNNCSNSQPKKLNP